jgi:succinate dehydrogenase / fumarate reductase cytochrome b subunit
MTGTAFCVIAISVMKSILNVLTSSIGKKFFMAVTGVLLGFFLIVHAIGNSTTLISKEVFNSYAEHLHSLGYLIPVFEIGLLIIFLTHVTFAFILFFENFQARDSRYQMQKSSGGRTLGSRTMPYTGVIILIFIAIHLNNFHFIEKTTTIGELVKSTLSQPVTGLFYIAAMVALILHLSHGFWSLFQTLGINHPRYNCSIRKGGLVLTIILGAIFVLIPLLALIWKGFLS